MISTARARRARQWLLLNGMLRIEPCVQKERAGGFVQDPPALVACRADSRRAWMNTVRCMNPPWISIRARAPFPVREPLCGGLPSNPQGLCRLLPRRARPHPTEGCAGGSAQRDSAVGGRQNRWSPACGCSSPAVRLAGGGVVAGLQRSGTGDDGAGRVLITHRCSQHGVQQRQEAL